MTAAAAAAAPTAVVVVIGTGPPVELGPDGGRVALDVAAPPAAINFNQNIIINTRSRVHVDLARISGYVYFKLS